MAFGLIAYCAITTFVLCHFFFNFDFLFCFFLFCADRLKEFFETYGKVQSVEIIFDNITHKSRNFAFLAFEDENVAKHVLSLRTVVIDGRTVTFFA